MKEVWYGADRNHSVVHANICMTSNFLYVTLFVISECFANCQQKSYSAKTYASFIPEPEQWRVVVPCYVARWLVTLIASHSELQGSCKPSSCLYCYGITNDANKRDCSLTTWVQYQDSICGISGVTMGNEPGLSQILRISRANPSIHFWLSVVITRGHRNIITCKRKLPHTWAISDYQRSSDYLRSYI